MNFDEIEDTLIQTIVNLELLRKVDSAGRKALPSTLTYPSAYVYMKSMQALTIKSRSAYKVTYDIVIVNKNLSSEQAAAKDIYAIIIAVKNAIHNQSLDIENIDVFACTLVELTGYEAGEIGYTLRFETNMYL